MPTKKRKPGPKKEFPDVMVVRLTPELREQSAAAAKRIGLSLSEWTRRLMEDALYASGVRGRPGVGESGGE